MQAIQGPWQTAPHRKAALVVLFGSCWRRIKVWLQCVLFEGFNVLLPQSNVVLPLSLNILLPPTPLQLWYDALPS